ncbi:KLK14 protein, partial [Geococcyx californianus]|nr:KLK14 protein [Geococcyx californianus]
LGRDIQVLLGTDQVHRGGTRRSVVAAKVHPKYNPRRNDNDFMLLRLERPVEFSRNVKMIKLAKRCPQEGTRCSVSGWGTIRSP